MIGANRVETASPQFVRAVAARLVAARGRRPLLFVALRSRRRFTMRNLRDAEAGLLPLDLATVEALAVAYRVPMSALMPSSRSRLVVRPEGLVAAGGRTVPFEPGDPESVMTAFVRLLHQIREPDGRAPVRDGDARTLAMFMDDQGFDDPTPTGVTRLVADHPPETGTIDRSTIELIVATVVNHRRQR